MSNLDIFFSWLVFDPSTSETLGIEPCLPKLLLLGVVDVGVVVGPLVASDKQFCVLLKIYFILNEKIYRLAAFLKVAVLNQLYA